MADMSDFLEVTLLNLSLNGTSWAGMDNPYISLHTADPTDTGTGTEVTGGSYARVASSFGVASGTSGALASDADATFPTATAGWGYSWVDWSLGFFIRWQHALSFCFRCSENN